MKKIKVIGAGGIGSILLPILCQFLDTNNEDVSITIIDGKNYSPKNRTRQLFNKLGNKAEVSVEKLSQSTSRLIFRAQSEYVTDKSILYLLEDGDIIFSCVDNHKTRLLLSDFCSNELNDVVLFSGGNGFLDGSVQIFARSNGQNITLPIANKFHPEIVTPKDKRPDELSCEELQVSSPQLIFTNNMVAAVMLNAFYNYFYAEKKHDYNEVYLDVNTNKVRSLIRS